MPKELRPSDKFQRRGRGDLMHPGVCLACGSGNCDEGYIDLGTYFDYEGQMYLCQRCIEEAGEVAGMLVISESKFLQERSEQMALELANLKEQLTNANRRLRAYDDILNSVRPDFAASDSSYLEVDEHVAEDPAQLVLAIGGHVGSAINGESESTESVKSGSGPSGITRSERSDSGKFSPGVAI